MYGRVQGDLASARSFGDFMADYYAVFCEEMKHDPITKLNYATLTLRVANANTKICVILPMEMRRSEKPIKRDKKIPTQKDPPKRL